MKYLISLKTYLHAAISELKKVTWPTKQQITMYSIIVIAMRVGVAIFFGALDFILNKGLSAIIS